MFFYLATTCNLYNATKSASCVMSGYIYVLFCEIARAFPGIFQPFSDLAEVVSMGSGGFHQVITTSRRITRDRQSMLNSSVHWNRFSDVTEWTWITCIQWRQRTIFPAPSGTYNLRRCVLLSKMPLGRSFSLFQARLLRERERGGGGGGGGRGRES